MPVTGGTDPAALLMSRMGPGAAPGPGGPPGAPPMGPTPFTGNAAGGQQGPQMTPQMLELAQLAQRLLMTQQGTQYLGQFLRRIAMMIKSASASQFMQNQRANTQLAQAQERVLKAVDHLSDNAPNASGPISISLMELVKPQVQPGGSPAGPAGAGGMAAPPPGGPAPPAYPLG